MNEKRHISIYSNLKLYAVIISDKSDWKGDLSLFILYISVLFECFTILLYYSFLKNKTKHNHLFISSNHSGKS